MRRDRDLLFRAIGYFCLTVAAVAIVAGTVEMLICLGVIKR